VTIVCCIMVCWRIVLTRWWWSDVYLRSVGMWLWQWMYQKTCTVVKVDIFHSHVVLRHC